MLTPVKDVGAVTAREPPVAVVGSKRGSGASGTLLVTLTKMPSAKPTTAPIAMAEPTLRA